MRNREVRGCSKSVSGGTGRTPIWAVSVALVGLWLLTLPGLAAAAGSPDIALDKSADAGVLYGQNSNVTLTASNPIGQPTGYNLSFRDVLPNGISYVGGSSPANVGEPQIINNAPVAGQTTLIWSNLADLTANSSFSFDFRVAHNQGIYSVGDSYTNTAGAYLNSDPRFVPDFNALGQPVADFTGSATDGATTKIEAIEITKDEPSPEGELLRGLHQHQTVYTLSVQNNYVNASNTLAVEDYLPAGLEFLGCGGVDNTTDAPTNPGSAQEYPGSGPINPGNEPGGGWQADCVAPTTVETVANPPGLPAGVYTHVVWQGLPNLGPSNLYKLKYAAAIPIRENTTNWGGPAPGTGGAQIANLNNNSGPETFDEQALTNYAAATASYQAPGGPFEVTDSTDLTRTAEDLRILKSVTPTGLGIGAISEWSLQIDTSEYRYVDNLVVSDTLGNGYCPLSSTNLETTPPPAAAECDPVVGTLPSAPYKSATEQTDGTWDITWDSSTDPALAQIQPSSSHTITFPTRTRAFYQSNFANSTPVLARDTAVNDVSITGDNFIICAPGAPDCTGGTPKINSDMIDGSPVTDVSSAEQSGDAPTINKTVSPTINGTCSALNDYVDGPPPVARPGDSVCWRLNMTFPPSLDSGNVDVSDFIPPGTTYINGSTAVTGNNNAIIVSAVPPEPDVSGPRLNWPLDDGAGSVVQAAVFEVTFATRVTRNLTSADGDISDNLMKSVFSNTNGTTFPLRDAASFELSQPEIDLVKGVRDINGVPAGGRAPNVDGGTVTGGDQVTYRIDLTNDGSLDASNTQVWDLLPGEVSCADVAPISDGGTCNVVQNRIEWTGVGVLAGGSKTLTYTVSIPDGLTSGDVLINNAGVRQFESASGSGPFVSIPASNIDPTQEPNANAPRADDPSNVQIEDVGLVKSRTTEINEPGNNLANQATIGEKITYTVTATIPEGTTFYGPDTNLLDNLGTRQTLVPGSASATLDNGFGGPVVLPTAGLTLSTPGNAVRVDFPDPYANTAGSGDDVIVITFDVTVDDDFPGNQAQGTSLQRTLGNTVTASWQNADGDDRSKSSSTSTTIVEPAVSISKASDAVGLLTPGQIIDFTVTGSNGSAARNSTAHGTVIVDTLPVGLDPVNGGVPVADGGTVNPNGGIWNETARTITWPATTLAPGASVVYHYDAKVTEDAIGSGTLTNTAVITTTSMPGSVSGERDATTAAPGYKAQASLTGTLITGDITKSSSPGNATIGERVDQTLTVTIPANIRLYDVTVDDDLPDGLLFDSYTSAVCTAGCSGGTSDINPSTLNAIANGNGQRIGWYLGDLEPTAVPRTVVLKYSTIVASVYNGGGDVVDGNTLTNNADLLFNQTDKVTTPPVDPPDPAGFDQKKQTSADTGVVEPLLVLDKAVSDDPGNDDLRDTQPGDSYTYTVKVTNNGTSPAFDVSVTDQPDTELINVVVATGAGWTVIDDWTPGDPAIKWLIPGPIAPGASVTLTYTADLIPSSGLTNGQEVDNTADVPSYFGVPEATRTDPANVGIDYREYDNVVPDSVKLIVRIPKLELVKTTGVAGFPDNAPANIEQSFPWRIVITNSNDPSILNGVDLTDVLPLNWTYDAGSAQVTGTGNLTPGGQVEPGITADPAGDKLSWPNLGDLDGGETIVVNFTATPKPAAAINPGTGVPHLNDASATGEDTSGADASADGPYADSDDATATLDVPETDLQITKVANDPTPVAGTDTTWTLTVKNNGPKTSPGVIVSDVLPGGLTYVSAVPDRGTCNEGPPDTVTCDLGQMAPNDVIGIVLTTTVGADQIGNVIQNTATVDDPSIIDTDPSNNTSTDDVTPAGSADLSITKGLVKGLAVGQIGTYRLTVTNDGPSFAVAVKVSDLLPANLAFVAGRTPVGSCGNTGQQVDCVLGDLAPGAVVLIEIDVDVLSGGTTTNPATVSSDTPDPDPGNNNTQRTDPADNADLALKKTGPAGLVEGQTHAYTLEVSNVGMIASFGPVTVTDPLPDSLTPVGASGNGWSCGIVARLVTCTRGDSLAPGDVFPLISIEATTNAGQAGKQIENVATVNLKDDPNPGNDTGSTSAPVISDIAGKCLDGTISVKPSRVWVGQAARVVVVVKSESGKPAAGVPVELAGNGEGGASRKVRTATTNKRGRAIFEVRANQASAVWTARVTDCQIKVKLRARKQQTCGAIKVNPRSIKAGEVRKVRVRLQTPTGRPLVGVRVSAKGVGTYRMARTDRKGQAVLRLKPKRGGTVAIRAKQATSCRIKIGVRDSGTASGSQLTG